MPVAPPIRSVLFVPGANERALRKARELPADSLIIDLEDAVATAAKTQARARVCDHLAADHLAADHLAPGPFGTRRSVAVRVNALGSDHHVDDIAAVARSNATAVVVPKVEHAGDLVKVERSLEQAGASDALEIWAMIETPLAVLNLRDIAAASRRLRALIVGPNDLNRALRAAPVPDRGPLLTSLTLCVLAARAYGLTVLDGVFNDITDRIGFEAECRQARALGFDGKTLIHPGQIDTCNRVFSPGEAELEYARRVIAVYEEAAAEGRGVALLDGVMIEHLHVQSARALLATTEA